MSETSTIFEQATRQKLRFTTSKGSISTEDLWSLSLESLDAIAKGLNKEIKDSAEESFIAEKSSTNKTLELKFDIVKHIIKVKLAEKADKQAAAQKQQRIKEIEGLIAQKQSEALSSKSIEELNAELTLLKG